MTSEPSRAPGVLQTILSSLIRLPDFRAAVEGLGLFLLVVGMGIWGVYSGVLERDPVERSQILMISLTTFFFPVLTEELAFRGWVRAGAPIGAVASLIAYIFWHPLQTMLGLPFAREEFTDPSFLSIVATLGLACTLTRLRSGSIWPGVAIHWGAVVVWRVLFAGTGAA